MAVIAGNWKMHLGPAEAVTYLEALDLDGVASAHEVLLFPSVAALHAASATAHRDERVRLGVQNVHWEEQGAFTGETSALIAAGAGATHLLVGHSERRHVFGETDAETALKVLAGARHDLVPVLCVGETIDERRAGSVDDVITRQLDAALDALRGCPRFLLAYEPVWAIGTGETATPEDAAAAHGTLRRHLEGALGPGEAAGVPILYGGSVKPGNAAELMAARDVDGVLVGGASLDPTSFREIALAAG